MTANKPGVFKRTFFSIFDLIMGASWMLLILYLVVNTLK